MIRDHFAYNVASNIPQSSAWTNQEQVQRCIHGLPGLGELNWKNNIVMNNPQPFHVVVANNL